MRMVSLFAFCMLLFLAVSKGDDPKAKGPPRKKARISEEPQRVKVDDSRAKRLLGPLINDVTEDVFSGSIEDKDVGRRGAAAIEDIGPRATAFISCLRRVLQDSRDPDDVVRIHAARALSGLGSEGKTAARIAIIALQGSSPEVRALTAEGGGVSPDKDPNPEIRALAAAALGRIGPATPEVVPALIKALKEDDPRVRRAAAKSLVEIAPEQKATVPAALLEQLKDKSLDQEEKHVPIDDLRVKEVFRRIEKMTQELDSPDKGVRRRAADDLEEIVRHIALVSWSEQILQRAPQFRQDDVGRLHAARALSLFGAAGKLAAPVAIAALQDTSSGVRAEAAAALGQIGPVTQEVVPALIKALKDNDPHVRRCSAASLGVIGPQANAAVPELIELLKDKKQSTAIRGGCALALAYIGPAAKPAVPALLEILQAQEDPTLQANVLAPLGKIGAKEGIVIPALLKALKDKNRQHVRGGAARALGEFGLRAKEAIPALVAALDVSDVKDGQRAEFIQGCVLDALANMGPAAVVAIPEIKKILDDPEVNSRTRDIAKRTLKRIQE